LFLEFEERRARQAEAVSTAEGRLHLLRIADEFEQLADSIGGSAAASKKGADRVRRSLIQVV